MMLKCTRTVLASGPVDRVRVSVRRNTRAFGEGLGRLLHDSRYGCDGNYRGLSTGHLLFLLGEKEVGEKGGGGGAGAAQLPYVAVCISRRAVDEPCLFISDSFFFFLLHVVVCRAREISVLILFDGVEDIGAKMSGPDMTVQTGFEEQSVRTLRDRPKFHMWVMTERGGSSSKRPGGEGKKVTG